MKSDKNVSALPPEIANYNKGIQHGRNLGDNLHSNFKGIRAIDMKRFLDEDFKTGFIHGILTRSNQIKKEEEEKKQIAQQAFNNFFKFYCLMKLFKYEK